MKGYTIAHDDCVYFFLSILACNPILIRSKDTMRAYCLLLLLMMIAIAITKSPPSNHLKSFGKNGCGKDASCENLICDCT